MNWKDRKRCANGRDSRAKFHYVERPAGISQHIIIYCVEGRGWIEIDKKRMEIGPSQFITIPANIAHKYAANEKDPWTIYWIHFKGEIAAYIVDLILQNSKNYKPELLSAWVWTINIISRGCFRN